MLRTVPSPTKAGIQSLIGASRLITSKIRSRRGGAIAPIEYLQVYEKYAGSKRRVYELAHAWIDANGEPSRRHGFVKSFVKAEKTYADPKAPRIIQARDPVYNLEIGTFLKPIEHAVYELTGFKFFRGRGRRAVSRSIGGRIVAKGMNDVERAATIAAKLAGFRKGLVYSLDCTKFDAHVAFSILQKVEHASYLRLNNDPMFQRLLSWQLENKGTTAHGVKYKCRGGRMSGDVNTASGNVFLMLTMMIAYLRPLGIPFDLLDDGDDCLLFIEESDESTVTSSIGAAFLTYGHELKLENRATELPDVVFCRSKPTYREYLGSTGITGGWTMVRDYRHVIKQSLVSHRHYNTTKGRAVARSVGLALLGMYRGVPVLQAYALMVLRLTEGVEPVEFDHKSGIGYKYYCETGSWYPKAIDTAAVTTTSRALFERTWGLPTDEQLALEAKFDGTTTQEFHFDLEDVGEEVFIGEDGTVLDYSQGFSDPHLYKYDRDESGARGGVIDDPATSTAYSRN